MPIHIQWILFPEQPVYIGKKLNQTGRTTKHFALPVMMALLAMDSLFTIEEVVSIG